MTMQATLQGSPSVQRELQGDELRRALWENRLKMLQFAIAQQITNPETGRYGAQPVLDQSGAMQGNMPGLGMGQGMPLKLGGQPQ